MTLEIESKYNKRLVSHFKSRRQACERAFGILIVDFMPSEKLEMVRDSLSFQSLLFKAVGSL